MNGSPASSSASPPPAPPPLPISVRANYCARCRFNIAHSRHDLNSSMPNGNVPTATGTTNYGIPQTTYTGYDGQTRGLEDEDSAYPALLEREFHSLHRNVPGLRRAGVDTTAIRQHFYPDGGWGWIVCGVAFLAHVLTSGFQLSYGLLLLYCMRHLGHKADTEAAWLGAASWATSLFTASIVVAFCRRKSTRLTAVIGGLVLALGILFTSFATQLHQIGFSFGLIVGFGASLVRESSSVMIGHYFKRRRHFVEMIVMSGEGVGVALFSVILKEGVGKMGWRLGLQAVTGLATCSFFMGMLYRPASLYHPQRRAILHLKNQRKKVKEKKTHIRTPKPPFMDFTPLKTATVKVLCASSAVAAFGIYSPIFFMSLHGYQEGYDMQDLVLIQTFIGLSIAIGIVAGGSAINKTCHLAQYRKIKISRQYVCQGCVTLSAISMLVLSSIGEHHYFCLVAWIYGLSLGGYKYSLKMLSLERIRGRHFTKAWGFIKGAESLPVLLSVPLTGFLNEYSAQYGRAGYYLCATAALVAAIGFSFVGHTDEARRPLSASKYSNGSVMSRCTTQPSTDCRHSLSRSYSLNHRPHWTTHSPYTSMSHAGYSAASHCQCNPAAAAAASYYPHQLGGYCSDQPGRLQKSYSFAFQSLPQDAYLGDGCNSINRRSRCELHRQHQQQQPHYQQYHVPYSYCNGGTGGGGGPYLHHPLQQNGNLHARSRSVPEGLSCNGGAGSYWNAAAAYRPQVHVVEQMTTSV